MSARITWERNGRPTTTAIESVVTIGRDPSCQIRGDVPELASAHCRIVRHGGEYRVEHVAGAPTRINGTPVAEGERVLADGDEIACAGFVVRFLMRRPTPMPTLPRRDAETQRLPVEMPRERPRATRNPDVTGRLEALERENAELRARIEELISENQRLRGS